LPSILKIDLLKYNIRLTFRTYILQANSEICVFYCRRVLSCQLLTRMVWSALDSDVWYAENCRINLNGSCLGVCATVCFTQTHSDYPA
jgi:hypothetical protein